MSALGAGLQKIVGGDPSLAPGEMEAAVAEILSGDADPVVLGAFLVALRMRGETAAEIAAAARAIRAAAQRVDLGVAGGGPLLDTCGTGGDGAGTFNISTATAVVVAACGVRVAKHGNRAVSSRSGSADVLESLGVRLELGTDEVARCVREVGIGFLYAPRHHGALRHAGAVRRRLGMRTLFNLLGPLANPAGATHQLLGVFAPRWVRPVAEVLRELGLQGGWVVHGEGGLDEMSPSGPTQIAALRQGEIEELSLSPEDFGLPRVDLADLAGGDADENAAILRRLFAGEAGAPRTAVVLNAAAALCAAELHPNDAAGRAAAVSQVEGALDAGEATEVLTRWGALSAALAEGSA